MSELEDRRCLVTGASRGIGEHTARALAGAGAHVAVTARSEGALTRLADEIGGVAVPADVRDAAEVTAAVDRAAEALGGLDGLVNVAGLARPGSPSSGDPAEWRLMFDVNVLGLLHATRAAVPHLRRAGRGDIVNLSSMSGRRLGSVASTVYSASKFAVHTITEGLRRELTPEGVRVTTIAPGYVDTGLFDELPDEQQRRQLQQTVAEQGLDPAVVAAQVVHAVSQPPDVELVEIALLSTRQR